MRRERRVVGWQFVMIGLLVLLMSGCAGSRYVSQATSQGDTIKFAYTQKKLFETEQGIVQCKIAEDGGLYNCKKIDVTFAE